MITQAQIDLLTSTRARFDSKYTVDPGGCWNWTASISKGGYGCFNLTFSPRGRTNSKTGFYCWQAHRVSWLLHKGAIPDGQNVLHRCDNTRCINPGHLFLGTQADNVHDMHAKGRNPSLKGMGNGNNRLSDKQVLTLRGSVAPLLEAGTLSRKDAADLMGITACQLGKILRGEAWAHLLPVPDQWDDAEDDHKQMVASGGSGVWAAPYMADPF